MNVPFCIFIYCMNANQALSCLCALLLGEWGRGGVGWGRKAGGLRSVALLVGTPCETCLACVHHCYAWGEGGASWMLVSSNLTLVMQYGNILAWFYLVSRYRYTSTQTTAVLLSCRIQYLVVPP